MKAIRIVICSFVIHLLFLTPTKAQPQDTSYIRLDDASGYTPTTTQLNSLEEAASRLCAAFDSAGFGGQFKVYDFGFYLHQEVAEGGYPEPFAQKIAEVADLSPYYLLFGKQSDRNGIYKKFWVELVLPDTGKFECLNLLSPTLRSEIKQKIEYVVVNAYLKSGSDYLYFDVAEKAGIDVLQEIAVKYTECCDLQSRSVNSCDAFVLPAQIKEVTYSGDAYIEMKQDGNVNFGQPFPIPHYLDTRPDNEQSPLALVGGFNVSALVKFNGNELYETIKVRGKGEKEVAGITVVFNFDEQVASQDIMTKQIAANLGSSLPYMAVFLDDLKITWEMRVKRTGEPEADWEPVGESINNWYLTLRKPKPEGTGVGYAHYQTLFEIGCKYGRGTSDPEILNGVWSHFKNKEVSRSDGEHLAYYKTWEPDPTPEIAWVYTDELLKNREGQCNAWAKFFLDILKAQGYSENGSLLIVKPDPVSQNRPSSGFILGHWNFLKGIAINEDEFDYWNLYNNENKYSQSSSGLWSHLWWQNSSAPLPQVIQTGYIPAQGNPNNSLSYFGQHIIVKIFSGGSEKYLDPSYGEEYDAELSNLEGFVAGFWLELLDYTPPAFINPPPSNDFNDLVLFRKNTALEKLVIINE